MIRYSPATTLPWRKKFHRSYSVNTRFYYLDSYTTMLAKKPETPFASYRKNETVSSSEQGLRQSAIGLESEFGLVVNEQSVKPEDVFKTPQAFIRQSLMHRVGTSYHLPTGNAVYFDTGVIELATPVIEIEKGCAARAGRSLWESLWFIRNELDAWEQQTGHTARLVGFSTHYNVSFDLEETYPGDPRTVEDLAYLLAHILPLPVMMLATNRQSTGIGVRPRPGRIEITADFTPSPALMIATATLITGIVRTVMQWPSYELGMLRQLGLPVIEGFKPMRHTSRKGWLARHDCYPQSPFTTDPNAAHWTIAPSNSTPTGDTRTTFSLRDLAIVITRHFRTGIRTLCDPFTLRLINRVLLGRTPALLDLDERPEAYEHAGRLCSWDDLFPESMLERSRYERVLIRAIAGNHLTLDGTTYKPLRLRGWSEVVFARPSDGTRHVFSLDFLADHLDAWY